MVALALAAIFPAVATPFFFVFWRWFEVWRRHRAAIAMLLVVTVASWIAVLVVWRAWWLAPAIAMPAALRALGWALAAVSFVLSVVADRQLGLRVRAGLPLLDGERIRLRTRGAYAVVRHPIYAAGIYYQVGMFCVTGAIAIAGAAAVLVAGALWFTREEERRLAAVVDDAAAYAAYRARVGRLVPRWPRYARRRPVTS
jgi:protein-S-isoprenylcysteine O-methyltransferase Ste14